MVEKEELTPNIEEVRRALLSAEMKRNPDGKWTLIIEIGGIVQIDEHRKAGFFGEARIQGAQSGRRPNPPRKADKSGKFKKARKAKD